MTLTMAGVWVANTLRIFTTGYRGVLVVQPLASKKSGAANGLSGENL